jgi:hypothetical protein
MALGADNNYHWVITANGYLQQYAGGGYINFGSAAGSTGYGLRDNAGAIEYKDSGGSWVALNSLGGGSSNPLNVGTDDTTAGLINVYGGGIYANGGKVRLYNSATYDGTYDYYELSACFNADTADFAIGSDQYPGAFKINGWGNVYITHGMLNIGVNDSYRGGIYIYANASDEEPFISLYVPPSYDDSIDRYVITLDQDDFIIGTTADADILKLDANKDLYVTAGSIVLPTSEYLNFGGSLGSGGYGFRDNAGAMEFKNSGGVWTSLATLTGLDLAPKTVSFTAAPSSDHEASGVIENFTAGEAVAFGDVCYFKSDGKMWKADADASSTMPVKAMAIESISADSSGKFLMVGFARDDTWAWTVGGLIYADVTAGALTQTAPSGTGDQVQVVGWASHADRMFFNPDYTLVEI